MDFGYLDNISSFQGHRPWKEDYDLYTSVFYYVCYLFLVFIEGYNTF